MNADNGTSSETGTIATVLKLLRADLLSTLPNPEVGFCQEPVKEIIIL